MADPTLRQSGIYCITHVPSGLIYVGSAVNMAKRWNVHRCELRKGCHHSRRMQACWNTDHHSAFVIHILECVKDVDLLISREQDWLDLLAPTNPEHGFNSNPYAGSTLGYTPSDKARAKMSAAAAGRIISEETKAKLRLALLGRVMSPETLARMSAAQTGHAVSDAARLNMSKGQTGRKQSPETIAKRIATRIGKPRSEDTRRKISASWAQNDYVTSDETKAKLRAAWERRRAKFPPLVHTPEAKAKMSAAKKAACARRLIATDCRHESDAILGTLVVD